MQSRVSKSHANQYGVGKDQEGLSQNKICAGKCLQTYIIPKIEWIIWSYWLLKSICRNVPIYFKVDLIWKPF